MSVTLIDPYRFAGFDSDYELITTTTLSTTTASVTFGSLGDYSSTYKHLQIRVTARSNHSGANRTSGAIRLNADTGSNYAAHVLHGNGSSASAAAYSSATFMRNMVFFGSLPGASNTANAFGAAIIDILDPYSTSKNTTVRVFNGSAQTDSRLSLASGLWNNTASITSIEIAPNDDGSYGTSSFVSGSRFSLYGIKG
jgi:hypothetical protein